MISHEFNDVFLRITHGARQRELRVHVADNSYNVILFGSGQLVLRGNHFNIVGRALLESVLRHLQFAPRQLLSITRHCHLLGGGVQIQQRLAKLLINAAAQIGDLIVDALHAACQLLRLSIAIAVEEREIDLALNQARTLNAPMLRPISPKFPLMLNLGRARAWLALCCSISPARWLESER
jgi:hypothetical protein